MLYGRPPVTPISSSSPRASVAFWRDIRFLRAFGQIVFVALILALLAFLYQNMRAGLARQGLASGFDFLRLTASFDLGESVIPFSAADTYARAFLAGILNTLRVAVTGIILATLVGILTGVARVSPNWLLRQAATGYVELVRNTPLLVQLFFWYFGIVLQLPPVRQASALPGPTYLTTRGIYLPWLTPTETYAEWQFYLIAAAALVILGWAAIRWWGRRSGRPIPLWWYAAPLVAALGIAALGWLLASAPPLAATIPERRGLNFQGGLQLSPELSALLFGLVLYTGAFISEIVRAGILAVPRGQTEAALALGLSRSLVLRLVVFPQALRVIIPPLTSQYLNLTKNSSLAVAIGYPDLFFVATTIHNQTGRAIEVIAMVMVTYLTFSLLTSFILNTYNRRVRLVER
jgi:general L-amino acid transport system permease protein